VIYIFRSLELHFLIKYNRQKLTIHAGLIYNLLAPLDTLINNRYIKEAVTWTTTIDNVEEETFIMFYKFSYKGNYTTPYRKGKEDNSYFDIESK
jgi:hypothetical protein